MATLTRVQHNSANLSATAASLTATLPNVGGVVSGNLLVATIVVGTNVGTITPPAGWLQAGPTESVATFLQTQIFYLVVGTGGATSFVFSWTGSHSSGWTIDEWNSSTGWQSSPVDGSAGATPTTTALTCGSPATTTQASELWYGVLSWSNSGQTLSGVTSGWTTGDTSTYSGNNTNTSFYQIATSTGTPSLAATLSAAQSGEAGVVATFKPNVGSADMPRILPGPTWLKTFKPGMPRSRPWLSSSEKTVTGTFNLVLPTMNTSLVGTMINPADVPQINPGSTWLGYFKPGWPRPRPWLPSGHGGDIGAFAVVLPTPTMVLTGAVGHQGTLAITLPTPIIGLVAFKADRSSITQINPGPSWLGHFKPSLPRQRPIQPYPSPSVETGSLVISLPIVSISLSATIQHIGTLSIVLPAALSSLTATIVNPSDVSAINPGPTWLNLFKPGLVRPRPIQPQSGFVGEFGTLAINLPTLTITLNAFVPNVSDVGQINPGPMWLRRFKPGLAKPRPPITSTTAFIESGSLVLILPPGVNLQLEAGPLNIVLPTLTPSLQGKDQYGRLSIVLRTLLFNWAGTTQLTEQGALNITLPLTLLHLSGINGRETGTLSIKLVTVHIFSFGVIVHNGTFFINMTTGIGTEMLTRYEMFGAETRGELAAKLPGPELGLVGTVQYTGAQVSGYQRAKNVRTQRRHQLKLARAQAAVDKPPRQGEDI